VVHRALGRAGVGRPLFLGWFAASAVRYDACMKTNVLLLNGAGPVNELEDVESALINAFVDRDCETNALTLRGMSIAPCLGCFGCWVRMPGVCVIDDDGREVARQMIRSDVIVYLTPVVFGGYSPELKGALDRSIGLISPLFERSHRETHHKKRYEVYPRLLGIGVRQGPNEEEAAIFEMLVRRNAINLHAPRAVTRVVNPDAETPIIQDTIDNAVEEVLAG